ARTGARLVLARRKGRAEGEAPAAVITGLAARMAERAAADRRLLLRRGAWTLLVLAVLAGLAWVLLFSPLLALDAERIKVDGVADPVDPATVVAVVEDEVGTPLLRVDTAEVAGRIAEIPTVREAQVSRSWPDGLAITVVPRVPVAAAAATDGGWVLVDADGVQVATAAEVPEGLPEVTVPLTSSEETAPALDAVLTVLGVLPEELLGQVAQAGATTPEQVMLTLDDGATVRWGSAEESELKAEVLAVLREEPAGVYDVSVPRTPTTSA
ncbi:cell division protein FtsQ/DivIB, partial [Georgenia subflava]